MSWCTPARVRYVSASPLPAAKRVCISRLTEQLPNCCSVTLDGHPRQAGLDGGSESENDTALVAWNLSQ